MRHTYHNISRADLVELLRMATKHEVFQFNGSLDEEIYGVAMSTPRATHGKRIYVFAMRIN